MIFFIGSIAGILILTRLAEKKDSKLLFAIAALLLIGVTGLRAEQVGIDTQNYYHQFRLIAKDSVFVSFKEIPFIYLCKFLIGAFNNHWVLIFVFSAITGIMLMWRLWELRDRASLSLMVILFLTFHLSASMNIMRQYIAIAIVFFATRYLEKRQYIKFLIGVAIGCCFHLSAILGVGLIPILVLSSNEVKNKYFKLLLLVATIGPLGILFALDKIDQYSFFLETKSDRTIGIGLIAKLVLLVLFWIRCVRTCKSKEQKSFLIFLCLTDAINIALSTLGYFLIYMDRVALLFAFAEIVLYSIMFYYPSKGGIILLNGKRISFFAVPIIVLILYVLFQTIVNDGHGIFPYLTFWQT